MHFLDDLLLVHLQSHQESHEVPLLLDANDDVVDRHVLVNVDWQEALLVTVLALK
jgi:hypothetical protein